MGRNGQRGLGVHRMKQKIKDLIIAIVVLAVMVNLADLIRIYLETKK